MSAVKIRSSTAQSKSDLDQLEQRTRSFAQSIGSDFEKGTRAVVKLGEDGSASLTNLSTSATQSTSVFSKLSTQLVALGPQALTGLIIAAVALAVAFSPLIVELATFAIGLSASIAVATVGIGAFAGLAAGIVLLANATGNLAGPMAALRADVSDAAQALGQQAAPAAQRVLGTLDSLIAPVNDLASSVLDWANSNDRLGQGLQILQDMAAQLFGVLNDRLGPAMGSFIDQVLARWPQWEALFAAGLSQAAGAIEGLLTNLLRLSDWFQAELPVIGPGVQAAFDGIGTAIQGVGAALNTILIPLFQEMSQHTEVVRAEMIFLVAVLGAVVVAVAGLALIIQTLITGFANLFSWLANLDPAMRRMMAAHEAATGSSQHLTTAQSGLQQALNSVTQAMQSQSRATDAMLTGLENILPAATAVASAQQQLTAATGQGTTAEIARAQAAEGLVTALVGAAEAQQTSIGVTVDATSHADATAQAYLNVAASLRRMGDPGLAAQFEAMAARVTAAAHQVTVAVNNIPTMHVVNVTANISPALRALAAAGQAPPGVLRASGLQSGGPALPNRIYRVGETGPEWLVMGSQGGYVVPGGGGTPPSGARGDVAVTQNINIPVVLDSVVIGRLIDQRVDARLSQLLVST